MMNAASLVLLALVAQATPPSASPEARARAQVLLKEGAKFYEKGELASALEKFNQAYAEFQSPKLLFNIGQASRDLGRLAEAMDAFGHFLTEATDAPPDMTAEAKKSVAELEAKLGKLRIQCSTPGAEISVDGKPVGVVPITDFIWVMPGKHQVTARHPDTAPAIEDVEVNANWVHAVVISLQPLARVVATEPARARAPAVALEATKTEEPEPAKASAGSHHGRRWTWVAAGSAVVFAGTAAIFGTSMQSKYDSLKKSCGSESGADPHCSDSDVNSVISTRNAANVFWGLSAATAATAVVLFFVEGRSVSVTPMVGSTTGVLAGMTY
jgi:hypothetical protein